MNFGNPNRTPGEAEPDAPKGYGIAVPTEPDDLRRDWARWDDLYLPM